MPNTNSAKKRQRQGLVRRQRNRAAKSVLKTHVRRVREAISTGDLATAETEFRLTTKKIDQTAARGIVHDNMAARVKSRLSAAIKQAKTAGKPAAPAAKPAATKAASTKAKAAKAKK